MKLKFNDKNELYTFLEKNDLMGLDSEYSLSTQKLKKSFDAKGIHINKWWVRTSPLWICPVCNRSKSQILSLNKHGDLSGQLLEHHDHMSELLKLVFDSISSERESRIAGIDSLKFIEKIYPSDANFILIKVDNANKRYQQLLENGIVVRNRTTQPLCENCLRITIGTSAENLKLINTLKVL